MTYLLVSILVVGEGVEHECDGMRITKDIFSDPGENEGHIGGEDEPVAAGFL